MSVTSTRPGAYVVNGPGEALAAMDRARFRAPNATPAAELTWSFNRPTLHVYDGQGGEQVHEGPEGALPGTDAGTAYLLPALVRAEVTDLRLSDQTVMAII